MSGNYLLGDLLRNGSLLSGFQEFIVLPPELRPPEPLPIDEELAVEALVAQANRDGRICPFLWALLARPNVLRYLPESREPAGADKWTARTVLSHLPKGLTVQTLKLVRI